LVALLYCRNLYGNLGMRDGAMVRFRIRHAGIRGRPFRPQVRIGSCGRLNGWHLPMYPNVSWSSNIL
jgi:hypothetical protein